MKDRGKARAFVRRDKTRDRVHELCHVQQFTLHSTVFREQQGCFETHHPRGQWLASRKNFNRHRRIDRDRVFRKANQEDRAKDIFEAIEKHRLKISMVHRVVQEPDGNVLVVCRVRGGNSWCEGQSESLSFLLSRVLDTWQEKRLGFRCTRCTYT